MESQIKGDKVKVTISDQKSCEGLVHQARKQQLKVFGGMSAGAIAGYALANKKLGLTIQSMESNLKAISSAQSQGSAKLGRYVGMKDALLDGAELGWVHGGADQAQDALKIMNLDMDQFSHAFDKVAEIDGAKNVLDSDAESIKQAKQLKLKIESLRKSLPTKGQLSETQMRQLKNLDTEMRAFITRTKPFVAMRERTLIAALKKASVNATVIRASAKKLMKERRILALLGGVGGGVLARIFSLPMEAAVTPIEVADGTLSAEYLKDEKLFNDEVPAAEVCQYGMQKEYKDQFTNKLSNVFTLSVEDAQENLSSARRESSGIK